MAMTDHGRHTWATIPIGEHGDTATVAGVSLSCVLLRTGVIWLPTDLAHLNSIRDGQ